MAQSADARRVIFNSRDENSEGEADDVANTMHSALPDVQRVLPRLALLPHHDGALEQVGRVRPHRTPGPRL
jgi:hypothetical protein